MKLNDREEELRAWARWAQTEQAKPWCKWFAWFPVEDWDTGNWYWLETVAYKYRWDTSGARYYYKPIKKTQS